MYIYELFMNLDIEIDGYVIYKKKIFQNIKRQDQQRGPFLRRLKSVFQRLIMKEYET